MMETVDTDGGTEGACEIATAVADRHDRRGLTGPDDPLLPPRAGTPQTHALQCSNHNVFNTGSLV